MDDSIRVLVVGDDPLARGGLATLVQSQGFVVVGPMAPHEAPRLGLLPPPPHIAVWDLGSEFDGQLDRIRDVDAGGVPILGLIDDEANAQEALANGLRGVLFRDTPARRLSSSLRAILEGSIILDESLSSLFRSRQTASNNLAEPLTARETEVLQQLALGLSNKEIAQRLQMSEHTAKFHVNAILSKLGAQSRTEAVVRAARLGLLIL